MLFAVPVFLGGLLAAGIGVFTVVQWVMLGRIPAGLPGGGIMGAMEVASAGLMGSMAAVSLGATWSLLTYAIRGRRGPMIPAGVLRVFGVFVVAMFGAISVLAVSHGQSLLLLVTLPFLVGIGLLFSRRRS